MSLQDFLKEQFDALTKQRDAIQAAAAPLREERDRIMGEARTKADALSEKIGEIEKDLPQVMNDLGTAARAMGGRFMSDGKG